MGLFWGNRKTKEQKEEQMLAAILKQFEAEVHEGQDQKQNGKGQPSLFPVIKPDPSQKFANPLKKTGSVDDLARFLSSKGLFSYSDWEDFQTKKNG